MNTDAPEQDALSERITGRDIKLAACGERAYRARGLKYFQATGWKLGYNISPQKE
jgi:hypothetical protein